MRAKRPEANGNRGETTQGVERDSWRNDPVPFYGSEPPLLVKLLLPQKGCQVTQIRPCEGSIVLGMKICSTFSLLLAFCTLVPVLTILIFHSAQTYKLDTNRVIVVQSQMSNFSAISQREEDTFNEMMITSPRSQMPPVCLLEKKYKQLFQASKGTMFHNADIIQNMMQPYGILTSNST